MTTSLIELKDGTNQAIAIAPEHIAAVGQWGNGFAVVYLAGVPEPLKLNSKMSEVVEARRRALRGGGLKDLRLPAATS